MHFRTGMTISLIMLLVALGGCGKDGGNSGGKETMAGQGEMRQEAGLRDVTPAEAQTMIQARGGDEAFVLLDIRRPEEFAAGHLSGAGELDFYSPTFQEDLAALDKGKSYLIYCRTGHRSGIALGIMRELGFRDVANMLGGITRWQQEGLPVVR